MREKTNDKEQSLGKARTLAASLTEGELWLGDGRAAPSVGSPSPRSPVTHPYMLPPRHFPKQPSPTSTRGQTGLCRQGVGGHQAKCWGADPVEEPADDIGQHDTIQARCWVKVLAPPHHYLLYNTQTQSRGKVLQPAAQEKDGAQKNGFSL